MKTKREFFSRKTPQTSSTTHSTVSKQIIPSTSADNNFKISQLDRSIQSYDNAVRLSVRHQGSSDKVLIKLIEQTLGIPIYYPVIFDESILDDTQVKMSSVLRAQFGYSENDKINLEFIEEKNTPSAQINEIFIEIRQIKPQKSSIKINVSELEQLIKPFLLHYPIMPGQSLVIPYNERGMLEFKIIKTNDDNHLTAKSEEPHISYLHDGSLMNFSVSPKADNIILYVSRLPKTISLDFKDKGVGGHKKQLHQLLREGFYSRAMPSNYTKAYGQKQTNKGILLYGPPGTGKTLIARVIASCFTNDKVKLVNGPELKNKFVGQSAENLRNVFKDAENEWREKGSDSDLHVIIFDEIDALFPRRGTRAGDTGVDDDMVAQILTILDGVKSPQNILVIGTTNRKDLLDPALLRHGRLGVQIEINLPDEEARLEILIIHTKDMSENKLLYHDVDLAFWAEKTKNFTGGEIEQLVAKARQYAMANNFDMSEKKELALKGDIKSISQLEKVTKEHFIKAFSEMTPAFGMDKKYSRLQKEEFVVYDERMKEIISSYHSSLNTLKKEQQTNRLQMLISGPNGTGKTNLAMYLAKLSGASYIKFLTPNNFLSLPLVQQLNLLDEEFHNLECSEFGVIILDELESLLLADAELHSYSNPLRIKYQSLLKNLFDSQNKHLVIATTSNLQFIKRMNLFNLFNESIELNSIDLCLQNEKTCLETLTSLCSSLGYHITTATYINRNRSTISLSIRELIYQIKKFCSDERNNSTLDVEVFYESIRSKMAFDNILDDGLEERDTAITELVRQRNMLYQNTKEKTDEHADCWVELHKMDKCEL